MNDLDYFIARFTNNFPNIEDSRRIKTALENEKLYKGKSTEVFLDDFLKRLELSGLKFTNSVNTWSSPNVKSSYKTVLQGVNMAKPITNLFANMLFGDGLGVISKDEAQNKWLNGDEGSLDDGWIDRVMFGLEMNKSAKGGGFRGDNVIRLWQDDERKVNVSIIPSTHWFPIAYAEDDKKVKANAIVYNIQKTKENVEFYGLKEDEELLRIVISSVGKNYYIAMKKREDRNTIIEWDQVYFGALPQSAKQEEEKKVWIEETNINYPMIFRVPNDISDDSIYGISDYSDDTKTQMREIDIRFTQIGRILDKNSDPGMYGPPDLATEDENGEVVVETSGKYITMEEGDTAPGYLTWDAALDANFQAIQQAKENIYIETGTNSSALASSTDGIGVLSGTALEKIFLPIVIKANNRKLLWTPVLKNIIKAAYQLETKNNDIQPILIWKDILPKTKKEITENAILENGGLAIKSQLTTIKETNNYTDEQAKEEQEQIDMERKEREKVEIPNIDFTN